MTTEERRAELLDAVARHERELDSAVADLKDAVRRPLVTRVRGQIGDHPLPWILSALLIGCWLGSGGKRQEDL
ncbi:MAG TPA: hypothetical protein VL049_12925 [Candidatus Dormibacteraeota bacterium]|nr:hypothetical protein [Candidatus Dormibacteraeota bacterium]